LTLCAKALTLGHLLHCFDQLAVFLSIGLFKFFLVFMSTYPKIRYRRRLIESSKGLTLVELLVVIAIIGILGAFTAPSLFFTHKPLKSATEQTASIFKQARIRAISTTSAYRIRVDTASFLPTTTNATRFTVEAATSASCGADTILRVAAASGDTVLQVVSTTGFRVSDRISLVTPSTTSTTAYEILAVDPSAGTLTVNRSGSPAGTGLDSAQPIDTRVQAIDRWRGADLITSFTQDDRTLPQPRSPFGLVQQRIDESVAVPESVMINGNSTPWTLCFDSRGLTTLTNTNGGAVLAGNLALPIRRYIGSTAANTTVAQVSILRGGAVSTAVSFNNGSTFSSPARINE
jgi:prepilin-type N-terminal cleavage/methylation domain-containing protein